MSSDSSASSSSSSSSPLPTFFMSHGGGPSYFMTVEESNTFFPISSKSESAQWLRDFRKLYKLTDKVEGGKNPSAIVVVSAHYVKSGKKVHITKKKQHTKLNYDYGGFPAHTYEIEFNPPGSPDLADKISELFKSANIDYQIDEKWNFDHGVFVPLKMMFPDAEIPLVELSIDSSYDPSWHLSVGKALKSLKNENILLIGSGSSTHNFNPKEADNKNFMKALTNALASESIEEREKKSVLEWEKLPSARKAHPEEDHLVPLFVAVGAAGDQKATIVGEVKPAGAWHMASFKFQ